MRSHQGSSPVRRVRRLAEAEHSKPRTTSPTLLPIDRNRLLAAFSIPEMDRLRPHFKLVKLRVGQVVYESGRESKWVYFPVDSIVSMLYVLESGDTGEIALVGNDGMVGVATFLGGESSPCRWIVQCAGRACSLPAGVIREEFNRGGEVQSLLLRYTQSLIAQMTQTALCNRHHALEQQVCRWLLLSLDRLNSPELIMTQQLIANTLGVRREGVTVVAQRLQRGGVISYRRGHIKVLDRQLLKDGSCECYDAVLLEMLRLLPELYSNSRAS